MTNRIVMIWLLILVVSCVLVGATFWVLGWLTEKRYRTFQERNIPHIRQSILTLYFPNLLFTNKQTFGEKSLWLYRRFEKRKYVGFYALNDNQILIRNIAMIKNILIDDFSFFQDRTTYTISYTEKGNTPIWRSICSLTAEEWKVMRQVLSCYLTSKPFLDKCFDQCTRGSEELCAGIDRLLAADGDIDVLRLVTEYAARTTAQCVLGGDVERASSGLARWRAGAVHFRWVRSIRRRLRALAGGVGGSGDLLAFLATYRTRRVAYHRPSSSIVLSERERRSDDSPTVRVTDEVIASQAHLACLAGFEGARSVVAYALLEIARQPEVQGKIREEIDDSLERSGGVVAYARMLEMEYLDMVVNEVLRLHPPIATIGRQCTASYRFEGDRLRLARGDNVVMSVKGLHTDPRLWERPYEFDPERFNPDDARSQRHPCAFMPFGRGPRHCIGIRFAKLQYLTALFHVLSQFHVEEAFGGGGGGGRGGGGGGCAGEWDQPPHCRLRFSRRDRTTESSSSDRSF